MPASQRCAYLPLAKFLYVNAKAITKPVRANEAIVVSEISVLMAQRIPAEKGMTIRNIGNLLKIFIERKAFLKSSAKLLNTCLMNNDFEIFNVTDSHKIVLHLVILKILSLMNTISD